MRGNDGRAIWRARMAETAAIVAVYVVLARLGQIIAIPPGNVTPVYPAAGFALACVLLRGRRAAPGVWIGQFVGNTWAFADAGSFFALAATTTVGAVMSTGALLQALVGAGLIRRYCGASDPFYHVRHVFLFVASILLACVLSSTFGVASLCISGLTPWTRWLYVWLTWYLGDAVGILLIVPVLLTWPAIAPFLRVRSRIVEAALMVAVNAALALFVFAGLSPISAITDPLVFLSLPLLLWAAVRFNQFGVSLVILVVSCIAIAGTVEGHGPFAMRDPTISLWLLQLFVGVSMTTGLAFAAALNEQRRSEQVLRRTEHELQENYRIQKAISSLLRISLEPISLETMLDRSLATILSIPWLGLENKGAIYVARENPGVLDMKAQRGLPEELRELCANVPLEKCLCGGGGGAARREIIFLDQVDCRQERCYEGMAPHGHYSVPITSGEDLVGLMNLYVEAGHQEDALELKFLGAAADVLATTMRRKAAEDSLRDSRERFSLAVRGTHAGIWDWNIRTNKIYFSPAWKGMLGHAEGEISDNYHEWESRLHPDDRERALAAIRDYLDGKTASYDLEHRLRRRDGSYRWILARGAAVRDQSGKAYRMVGSHLDITDRKLSEEKLREREAELIVAQKIQEHLLPQSSPVSPGLDIAGAVQPSEFAAGDYFDYLKLPDGALGIVVGDVCGHGFSSALLTCSTSAHIRSYADTYDGIGDIVARTNRVLCGETDSGPFVTLFFARIDCLARSLSYVNAGHPPGYVLDEFGAAKAILKGAALPLGIVPDTEFPVQGPVDLEVGDTILLMTDGVLEAQSPDRRMFGVERALQVVREHRMGCAREIVESLHAAIRDFTRRDHAADDVTVVAIKVAEACRDI